jgi:hypothetical protein
MAQWQDGYEMQMKIDIDLMATKNSNCWSAAISGCCI